MAKKDIILKEVKNVIRNYNQKLTLRQIYYRLVAKLIIENKISQYKYLSSLLVDARKNNQIPYDAMEDRTREVINESEVNYRSWKQRLRDWIYTIKNIEYYIPNNLYQQEITLIVLEKQALEGIFRSVIKSTSSNAILVVCKGYNSLTQIWELSKILKNDNREIHCRFFSDFDPSGLDIQRNFKTQSVDLGIHFDSFKRIALKREQIKEYNLPYAPTKNSDSRSKNWDEKGSVELDALDPNILEEIIKRTCQENWDKDLGRSVNHLKTILNRRFRKNFSKELLKLAEKIENGEF